MSELAPAVSDKTKLAEVRRELSMRRKVYPRSSMPPHEQAQRIATMEAIVADYEAKVRADAGPLFSNNGGGNV